MGTCDDLVGRENLTQMLEYACKHMFKNKENDFQSEGMMQICLTLLSKDYKFTTISNENGVLCAQYPPKIPILEYELIDSTSADHEDLYSSSELQELFHKARFARCRSRFPVPVILYKGQHICRGATISGWGEIYGRTGMDLVLTGGENLPSSDQNSGPSAENQIFNRIRGSDIVLLQRLNVRFICDLMVEKKKVKFGMNVTSSEKVDKQSRYRGFSLVSVPYPGCEFFKLWRESGYIAEGLHFDWSQTYVDAELELASDNSFPDHLNWTQYKNWDLVTLTQNYLKLLLHYVDTGGSGLLIHCISGWDRTPLFVSLLRLTLWADGLIHRALSPTEIVYFTVAYDWYLFGHNFPDRLSKGEDIFFFCFNFLKYITSESFSVCSLPRHRHHTPQKERHKQAAETLLLERELSESRNSSSASFVSNVSSASDEEPQCSVSLAHGHSSPITFARSSQQRRDSTSAGGGMFEEAISSSWQLVNGCGSVRQSPVPPDPGHADLGRPCDSAGSARARRLDEARRTFLHCYTSLTSQTSSGSPQGGLANFLGSLAGKALGLGKRQNSAV